MVEFEKVQVGKTDAHLIGMQHGNNFFGEVIHGPRPPDVVEVQEYLKQFGKTPPVLVFEGDSKKQLKFLRKV